MNGYGGFAKALEDPETNMMILTPELVDTIHHQGGTFLQTARGGFDADKIIEWCLRYAVNQIYVVGGDGTHRGANVLFQELQRRVCFGLLSHVAPVHLDRRHPQDHR